MKKMNKINFIKKTHIDNLNKKKKKKTNLKKN